MKGTSENRLTAAEIDGGTRFYYDDQGHCGVRRQRHLLAKCVYGPEIDEPARMIRNDFSSLEKCLGCSNFWMKSMRIVPIALLALLIGCASPRRCGSEVVLKPKHIIGTWVGYDQDCLFFYRFTFANNGQGLCIVLFVDAKASAYRIAQWEINRKGLRIELIPVSVDVQAFALKAISGDHKEIRLLAKGLTGEWSHQITLHREEDVLRWINLSGKIEKEFTLDE